MSEPRVVVFSYGGFGCAGIDALVRAKARIVLGFSHADDPKETRWWPSVADRLEALKAPCVLDADLRSDGPEGAYARVRAAAPDAIFSFYFRSMIPERILALARLGGFNLHGSLLPRYRGRAPINWQLINGEKRSGLTLHRMVKSADAGDIVASTETPVDPDEDALSLTKRLMAISAGFLDAALPDLLAGRATFKPQDHARASVFRGRSPADGVIDWRWRSRRIHNLVRAVAPPWPGAFTSLEGRRVFIDRTKVLTESGSAEPAGTVLPDGSVACGGGTIQILAASDSSRTPLALQPGWVFDSLSASSAQRSSAS